MSIGPINWDAFRVHFFKDAFEQLIEVHGNCVDWEKATQCPNFIDNDRDQHTLDCPTCGDANGYVYYETIRTKTVMQALKLEHVFRAEGRFDLGTVIVTSFADCDIQIWDKLTMVDSTERYNEIVTRSEVTGNLTDTTRYSIDAMNIIQTPETIFVEDVDFIITDGEIVWLSATTSPTPGDVFTIDYVHHPVYVIVDMPNEIRDQLSLTHPLNTTRDTVFENLPKRQMAKRDYLIRDESLDTRK